MRQSKPAVYIYKPVIIDNLRSYFSDFSEVDPIDQHCSHEFQRLSVITDVEHHTVYRGEEMIALT